MVLMVFFMGALLGVLAGGALCVNYFRRELVLGSRLAARPAGAQEQPRTKRVARSAVRLLTAAACLLPAAGRARYAEEYRSELWELAQSGAGRLRQLRYALRQLFNVRRMGFALRSPRRRGAAP